MPQRGGEDGDWIDVRPRRRKALRQVLPGQDRVHEGKRLRNGDGFKLRHERVRYSSRGDCYDGDFDTSSDFPDSRTDWWDDRDGEKGFGAAADRNRRDRGVRFQTSRLPRRHGYAQYTAGFRRQQQREVARRQVESASDRNEAAGSERNTEGLRRKQ